MKKNTEEEQQFMVETKVLTADEKLEIKKLPDKEKLKNILEFLKHVIGTTKTPWVSWALIEKNYESLIGTTRKVEHDLWKIMEPVTYSLADDDPKAENPIIYEYKMGNAYYYTPVKMIRLYCQSEEL